MGDFDDSEFLKLANAGEGPSASIDRMKKNSEGEGKGSSFWEKGMEGLIPEAFKGGDKKKGPSQRERGGGEDERQRVKDEAERMRLIRKHNALFTNIEINRVLVEGGYTGGVLAMNTPLHLVQAQMDLLNSIRNRHAAKKLASIGMKKLNQFTESIVPSLKAPISLSQVWEEQAATKGSAIHLDMEELAIELEPYVTTGFWGRFAMDYAMLIERIQAIGQSPEFRAQVAQQEALSKQYDSDTENNLQDL
jgi:hypothetical protein